MDALKKEEIYTIDDIYALPDGERAELIDGKIYNMAPPNRTHQRILLSISRKIADYIDSKKGDCEINIAPFAVFLNKDDVNYVEPDISVVCDPVKLDEKGCHGAPDWIIEIVSPGSKAMDYFTKLFKYRTAGVYPLSGGHFCESGCQERKWQHQQGQLKQVQDPGQVCRNGYGHP